MPRRVAHSIACGLTAAACALLWTSTAGAAQPVGSWAFDDGTGTIARDSGPLGLNGTLLGPTWITGVTGRALRFGGDDEVALPDSPALEPGQITVAAWVRRAGSPGQYRYVLSKGASSCERSSYGLYTGSAQGAAFYVAGNGIYTVSPQAPARAVWDGRWHRLAGTFDGSRVRLYLDGAEVGAGTSGPTHIEYGLSSRAPYVGAYRGSCDLAFDGDIDALGVWGGALTATETAADAKPPATPTPGSGPVGPVPGTKRVKPAAKGVSVTPAGCTSLRVSRRSVRANRRTAFVATVRKGSRRVRGARVVVHAGKKRQVRRTNRQGRTRFVVRARPHHGRVKVAVAIRAKATCGSPRAYIRVRR